MGLNDEREKLNTAEEWLRTKHHRSQEWEAAREHVEWVWKNSTDQNLVSAASQILNAIAWKGNTEFRSDK